MPARVLLPALFAAIMAAAPTRAAEFVFSSRPGPLDSVHPDYELSTLLPGGESLKVVGMDWLPGGDMAILAWEDSSLWSIGGNRGWVHILSGARGAPAAPTSLRTAYFGLKYPMGLAVAGGSIHVSQRGSLVKLVDGNSDGVFDGLEEIAVYPDTVWDAWGKWALNLRYRNGVFYTGLGADHFVGRQGPCLPPAERGTVHTVDALGRVELLGSGLREPNGIGFGPDGELFATDNDGEWVAANKLVHVRKDDFHGLVPCQVRDPSLVPAPTAVWFPEHLRSPGEPLLLRAGPFAGQMVVGDYEVRNLSRVFLEKVGGNFQGALFPFTGGLAAGGLRLLADEGGSLYIGEIAIEQHEGWWVPGEERPARGGLQKLVPKAPAAFEMAAIRALPDGLELEFTRPAAAGAADPAGYRVKQWRLRSTADYGSPRLDLETPPIAEARLSADGRRVSLKIPGLKPDRLVHVQLHDDFRSADGALPWAYEAWYTLNSIPGSAGAAPPPPSPSRLAAPRVSLRADAAGRKALSVDFAGSVGRLELMDLQGRSVFTAPFSPRGEALLPADLRAGLYVLRLRSAGRDFLLGLPIF